MRGQKIRRIRVLILGLFLISILSPVLSAEGIRKIAYINLAKVFDSYYKTEEADKTLEKEGTKKNTERDKLVEKINKLKDEIELLSKETREKKEIEFNDKVRELQDFDREARTALQRKRDDMMKEIFNQIDNVIKEYGKKNGYDIIFDDRMLVYASEGIDITNDIIGILNKR